MTMDFTLDLKDVHTKDQLHLVLINTLPLPEYYGRTLDSLYDVLMEPHEEWNITIKNWENAEDRLGLYYLGFIGELNDAIENGASLKVRWEHIDENKGTDLEEKDTDLE